MRDPNDFTVPFQELIDSLEERVRYGVEQPASIAFFFKRAVTSYELPRDAFAITQVSGMTGGNFTVFEAGRQYSFSASRLIWIDETVRPDEGSRVEVEFTYRDLPSGLTDFNPGSVAGTLIRAAARELTLLYDQMDQAYRRAFIDQANGVALDNVVALLGEARQAAQKAQGKVTFFRKRAATQTVVIAKSTKVADQGGRAFVTTEEGRIPSVTDEIVSDRKVKNRIAELVGVWRRSDTADDAHKLPAAVDSDERTIKSAAAPAPPLPAGELLVRYKPKSVTVAIEALDAGSDSNVNAGTITIMPTPPPNVDGVTNEERTTGGMEAEPDNLLRERAKHALERAGNATLNAIKFSVLDVEGVRGVEVLDHQTDESIPLGEVRVRYAGGDRNRVFAAVEQTRAAGVIARLDEIIEVLISGVFYLLPGLQVPSEAPANFAQSAIDAMQALAIGAPLAVRRINALAYNIRGLADVAEAQLRFRKRSADNPTTFLEGNVLTDPLLIERTELVRPDKANFIAVVLTALEAVANGKSGANLFIDIQINDPANRGVRFRSLTIDLHVTLLAKLIKHPDQPPESIGSFTPPVSFTNSVTARLAITPANRADLKPGFNPAEHQKMVAVVITAAAYPGLGETKREIDFTA